MSVLDCISTNTNSFYGNLQLQFDYLVSVYSEIINLGQVLPLLGLTAPYYSSRKLHFTNRLSVISQTWPIYNGGNYKLWSIFFALPGWKSSRKKIVAFCRTLVKNILKVPLAATAKHFYDSVKQMVWFFTPSESQDHDNVWFHLIDYTRGEKNIYVELGLNSCLSINEIFD